MPGPPITVHIKRKATDDPVELLHVQNEVNGVRQRRQYVFKRQRTSTAPKGNACAPVAPPSFDTPEPVTSFFSTRSWTDMQSSPVGPAPDTQIKESKQFVSPHERAFREHGGGIGPQERPLEKPPHTTHEPRRFHLSRSSTPQSPVGGLPSLGRGARKMPTIFIEQPRDDSGATAPRKDCSSPRSIMKDHTLNPSKESASSLSATQQRPPAPLRNTRLPSGKVIPWNADPSQLATEMQAYTMQEIGHNLAKISRPTSDHPSGPMLKPKQMSKFKPKPQTPRFYEPPAEQAAPAVVNQQPGQDEAMEDAGDVDCDESSYVMDTYIRMPAEMFDMEGQNSVGVLILGSQPDIDEFYNDDSDSDSEIFDEEEDENAENHPSTDYPEDEVDSDDEYGRNPYRYRNRNASDNEEYDLTYSDDDEDEAKPPWARRPWMTKSTFRGNVEDRDEEY